MVRWQRTMAVFCRSSRDSREDREFYQAKTVIHVFRRSSASVYWRYVYVITVPKMNSTEVQNPRRKLDVFGSVLACAKSAHVFQKLSYSLCCLCLSLSSGKPQYRVL